MVGIQYVICVAPHLSKAQHLWGLGMDMSNETLATFGGPLLRMDCGWGNVAVLLTQLGGSGMGVSTAEQECRCFPPLRAWMAGLVVGFFFDGSPLRYAGRDVFMF